MEITAIPGLPEFRPGDNIATHIEEKVNLCKGDVLMIASTVVSKVEDRGSKLRDFPPSERAEYIAERTEAIENEPNDPQFIQAVIEESEELLLEAPFLLGVTHFGHITVNAGIDRSNVPEADLLLLPTDPMGSAKRIRNNLSVDAAVVVTDTTGRPFRHGQRGVALGWAGLPPNRDWRGESDREGRELSATIQCVVDELAGAANLVTGEGDGGTPVAVACGWEFGDHTGHEAVFRDEGEDLIRQALRKWSFNECW